MSSNMFRGPSQNIWIGLKFNALNFASWADYQPVTYINWGPGEPSIQTSSCTEMLYHGTAPWTPGHWKTASCDTKRPYICQKELDPAMEDNINQAPNPENCPKDYYPWDTSCYKISTRAGWGAMDSTAANDKCHSDAQGHPGYSGLVTIWNEHESQFVSSLFHDISTDVWMGLTYKFVRITIPARLTLIYLFLVHINRYNRYLIFFFRNQKLDLWSTHGTITCI